MIRRAFTMRLKPDALAEYKEHHDHIWPELVAEIERAGIASITTFQRDLDLFLVSEIADEAAWDTLWNSEVHRRWAEVMQPLMLLREDGIVDSGELHEVFHLTIRGNDNGRVSLLAVTNPELRSDSLMETHVESSPTSPSVASSTGAAPLLAPAAKPARKMAARRAKKAAAKKSVPKKKTPAKKSKGKTPTTAKKPGKKKAAKKSAPKKKMPAKQAKKTVKKKTAKKKRRK